MSAPYRNAWHSAGPDFLFSPRPSSSWGPAWAIWPPASTRTASSPIQELPHFPRATVASHQGNLLLGRLAGRPVAVLQGRFHFYEGYSTREVAFPIRVLSLLGARTLILTNAAGGLNPLFTPGTIMIIRDHLNFLGENPLRGPNVEEWGPRFPDLSQPYHPRLIKGSA